MAPKLHILCCTYPCIYKAYPLPGYTTRPACVPNCQMNFNGRRQNGDTIEHDYFQIREIPPGDSSLYPSRDSNSGPNHGPFKIYFLVQFLLLCSVSQKGPPYRCHVFPCKQRPQNTKVNRPLLTGKFSLC